MDQRVSLITLGVRDMARAAAFYDALGWKREDSPDAVVAYNLIGQTLGLYDLEALAQEIGVAVDTLGRGAMTLACNQRSREAVDAVMAQAAGAGARMLKSAEAAPWGGYHGYFADPEGHIWEVAHNPFSDLRDDGAFRWGGY